MVRPRISIAIPASIVSDVPSLQLKTYKIGQVGRASAIYCVDKILVYPDREYSKQREDIDLVCQILRYMDAPQYLRKRLFPLSRTLRFAGMLPPLNTPNHPTESHIASLAEGEFRDGVVVRSQGNGSLVDVGVEKLLKVSERIPPGDRRAFKIIKENKEMAHLELVDSSSIPKYWGYEAVELHQKLGAFMKRRLFDLTILTSKHGRRITDAIKEVEDKLRRSEKILIAFGSPKEELREILAREGLSDATADLVINTMPGQGTLSIRTEEAVHGTLATINLLIRRT